MLNSVEGIELLKPVITTPARFMLTRTGINYFGKNKIPVKDMISIDGNRRTGIIWKNYKTKLIQKLITKELIDEIDIKRIELLSKEDDILTLAKLVFYSILYSKFKPELSSILFNSAMMEKIKKENPNIRITEKSKFNPQIVNKFLNDNMQAINSVKEILTIDSFAIIDNEKDIKDKETKKKTIKSFINEIEPDMWFLFHILSKTGENFEILQEINELLINYLMKAKIADYLSMLISDILNFAEKAHFERLARIKKYTDGENQIEAILNNKNIRNELLEYASNTNTALTVFIKFPIGDLLEENKIKKVQYIIEHKGTPKDLKSKNINKDIKLIDYYLNNNYSNVAANYINYIEDECKKENINFVARLDTETKKDSTKIVLTFNI